MSEPRTCECDRPGLFNRAAWACWVGPELDGDGLPSTLHVGPTDGAHVHESDAEEVRRRLRSAGAAPLDVGTLALALHETMEHHDPGPRPHDHPIADSMMEMADRLLARLTRRDRPMSLHVHTWDAAGGLGCGACGEYRPEVYRCSWEGCEYRMFDAAHGDIEDHWREHLAAERSAGAAPLHVEECREALARCVEVLGFVAVNVPWDNVQEGVESMVIEALYPARALLERTDR